MSRKFSQYRENATRAVFITGEIAQAMVDRLTPEILRLRHMNDESITVYIDSPGGSTYHARLILQLLRSRNQDGHRCPLTTVVTGMAASAAADILAAGDYSIAYNHAVIHFHGVRTSYGDITHESASSLAEFLKQSNEGSALELADQILTRFIFVYLQLEKEFPKMRENAKTETSDVECVANSISSKLTPTSSKIIEAAVRKHQRLNRLLDYYRTQLKVDGGNFERPAEGEAFLLKSLVEWELKENPDTDWRFSSLGLDAIREDFVLLSDYEGGQHMKNIERQVKQWGSFLLEGNEQTQYISLEGAAQDSYLIETTGSKFRPIWHFLVSVCRALQQGENRLTPYDAYWLGLVDEVSGSSLLNFREVMERGENPTEASEKEPSPRRSKSKPKSSSSSRRGTVTDKVRKPRKPA